MRKNTILLAAALFGAGAAGFAQQRTSIGVASNFEGGNVGKVERVSAAHLRCASPGQSDQDHRNRQADWYYFELTNLPQTPVTIDLVDLGEEYDYRIQHSVTKDTRPVYSYDRVNWTHFSDSEVSWEDKEPHLTLHFTPTSDHIWIAHVPPYTNQDLARLLDSFRGSPYLEKQSVGRTVEGREMPLLTITNRKIPDSKKKVIWLMFRQHAWETGSSWAGDGAIRFLLSDDDRARRVRDENIVKMFPMADPDGVATGGVRFNKNGYDLNRNWDTIDPHTMPEIAAQQKAILDWVGSGHPLNLFLSLHNTNAPEYLEAPPAFRELGERFFQNLVRMTTFNPTTPLRKMDESMAPGKPGRMTVDQGLYHVRKLPAMLMEQMIEFNSKLGHFPRISDRQDFGAGLVQAMAATVRDQVE
jgi:hypothetical protein